MAVMPAVERPLDPLELLLPAPESAAGDELCAALVSVVPPTTGVVRVTMMVCGAVVPSEVFIVVICVMK